MPLIDDVPAAVTPAGQAFDYIDPPAFATVTLVNAPLDPDHSNIGLTPAVYGAFIDAEVAAGRAFGPVAVNLQNPDHDLMLEIAYEEAATYYNYGRLTIDGRDWFIFYTPEFLNKTTTRFIADIDEVASYSWTLGYSPVIRGHVAVAASVGDTYGDRYLTAPEPLTAEPVRGVLAADILSSSPGAWTVMVVSANDLRGDQHTGSTFPYFDKHVNADLISNASTLATEATINSAAAPQTVIARGTYPWVDIGTVQAGLPLGTPTNGYVPDGYLTPLVAGSATQSPDAPGTIRAELNTAAAWAALKAAHPEAHLNGSVAAYWSRALDIAIHNDPGAYGITDPTISPIGHSAHGLGIRLNIGGVDPSVPLSFGFTEYNSYTFTWPGPYSWNTGGGVPTLGTDVYVPKVAPSPLSTIDGVPAGGGVHLFTPEGFAEYMTIMQGAPWVLDGISSIQLVPSWSVSGGGDVAFSAAVPSQDPTDGIWNTAAAIPVYRDVVVSAVTGVSVLAGWRETVLEALGAGNWRKLVTSQFTDLLVGNGDITVSYKPDQWGSAGLDFQAVSGAAHGEQSIRLTPTSYNELGRQNAVEIASGGSAGMAKAGYGAAAANPATQDMSLYLNAFSSETNWQATFRNKQLAKALALTGIQMNLGLQGVSTALGAVTGAAAGALSGGPVGAAVGAAGAASGLAGLATASISAANNIQLLDISNDTSFDIATYMLGVSGQAAVASFDTWYQSLSSASGSGVAHHLASAWRAILGQAFQAIVVMPSAERVRFLLSEWARYGYMVGQTFTPPRLDAMSHMSYWQTDGAVILGPVPQQRRQTIAGAFDRGVTVWANIAEIGTDVRAVNTPTPGVTY